MNIRRCHVCKCTETNACPGRCWWIGEDLCSSCGVRASRHLRERPLLCRPRKFYWVRHIDIEMGFVRWSLRYCINGQMFGSDLHCGILEAQKYGRHWVANQLVEMRSYHQINLATLRVAATPESAQQLVKTHQCREIPQAPYTSL